MTVRSAKEADASASGEAVSAEASKNLEVGELFRGWVVAVSDSGHVVLANRKIDRDKARQALKAAVEDKTKFRGLVFGYNRGGFDVLVEGIRAFCPVRGLTLEDVKDPAGHLGQVVEFSVQGVKSGKNGIVVSRRSVLQKAAREKTRERLATLKVGDNVKSQVTHFLRHGVLLDLDGVAGLIPLAEVAWERRKRRRTCWWWARRSTSKSWRCLRRRPKAATKTATAIARRHCRVLEGPAARSLKPSSTNPRLGCLTVVSSGP